MKKEEEPEVRRDAYGKVLKKVEEKKEDPDAPRTDARGVVIKAAPDKKAEKKEVKMMLNE